MGAYLTVFIIDLKKILFANENKSFLKQRQKVFPEKKAEKLFGKLLTEKVNAKLRRAR
jgi:hypothetical protein